MEFQRLSGGGWRVFLLPSELKTLLESAKHHKCRIAIYLMALSLRKEPTTEVVPDDFFKKNGLWWLRVEGKDPTDRYHETRSRKVWIPTPIMKEIQSLIEERDLGPNDPLIDVGKRQLHNWIETTRENAATRTGYDGYERVSCHDFRRFFATHFLLRLEADQHVVRQLGGWKKVEHMWEYLLLPTDLVKRRLGRSGLLNTNPLELPGDKSPETITANVETIRKTFEESSSEDEAREALRDGVFELAELDSALSVTIHESKDDDSGDGDDSNQAPLSGFNPLFVDPVSGATVATTDRLQKEWDSVTVDDGEWGWRSRTQTAKAVCGLVGMLGLSGTLLASTGVYIDPMTLEASVPGQALPPLVLGSTIGSANVLWTDYRARAEDKKFTNWVAGLLENIFE